MKKIFFVLTLLILVFSVGCNNQHGSTVQNPLSDVEQEVQNQNTDSNGALALQSDGNENLDNSQPQITNDNHNSQAPAVSDQNDFIGKEKAKEIALEKAGLNESDVVFEKVELDFDDGFYQYEVEFRKGKTEYSADIRADDGKIIEWDVDYDD